MVGAFSFGVMFSAESLFTSLSFALDDLLVVVCKNEMKCATQINDFGSVHEKQKSMKYFATYNRAKCSSRSCGVIFKLPCLVEL